MWVCTPTTDDVLPLPAESKFPGGRSTASQDSWMTGIFFIAKQILLYAGINDPFISFTVSMLI